VLPINFHMDGDRILLRTARRGRLGTALHDAVVAFEADAFEPADQSGWSVAVTGVATEVRDPTTLAGINVEAVGCWAPAGDQTLIAISTEVVSGRRINRP
jgi:hypothetical protein